MSVTDKRLTGAALSYYQQNKWAYAEKALNDHMQAIRAHFLEQLPLGTHILELDCDSG